MKVMTRRSGGDVVCECLKVLGVDTVFGIVSVHNIPIYDALARDGGFRTIDARHEQAALHMADAYARATGRLGVAITSTGPGAANSVPGLFEAGFASSRVLMITGQVDTPFYGKGKGFLHEAENQLAMLRTVTRRSESPRRVEGIADALFAVARDVLDGRPQPGAVEIPIDLQYADAPAELPAFRPLPPREPDPADVRLAADAIDSAGRRVILAGGGVISAAASGALVALAEALDAPVFTTVNGRGAIAEDHPLAAGVLMSPPLGGSAIPGVFAGADLVIAAGTRFQSGATGNWQLPIGSLVHIDADPTVIGRNYRAEVAVTADARGALRAIGAAVNARPNDGEFNESVRAARREHEQAMRARIGPDHAAMLDALRAALPRDANVVRDATVPAYTWGNQLLAIYAPNTSLNTTSAAIGPGLPMAIGAAIGSGRKTALIAGDGGFMLHIGELATAAQYRLPLIICLFNDRGYGVLRGIQKMRFDGRTTGVDIHTPDFVRVAEGMGVQAERVASAAGFAGAIERAVAAEGPVLLDIDQTAMQPIRLFG